VHRYLQRKVFVNMHVPTNEIIQRVFAISPDAQCFGSALAYPVNGFFYFITAAHVLEGMQHGVSSEIHIFRENNWTEVTATPFFAARRSYQAGDMDIAIVQTTIPVPANEPEIVLDAGGVIFGQDVYFLGFPYFGSSIDHKAEAFNAGYPIPFVKKATVAALQYPLIYLDGHNNPGFSGGPVMFWDYNQNRRKICGVISAYLNHTGEIKRIETTTKEFYQENSGIGIAYSIKPIVDLIDDLRQSSDNNSRQASS